MTQTPELAINLGRVQALRDAAVEEFPGHAVFVLVGNGLGQSTYSFNTHPLVMAGLLEHAAQHLRNECKVCPKSGI